jgi:type I restriction enzyme S subunit
MTEGKTKKGNSEKGIVKSEWREVMLQDVVSILGDGLHGTPQYDERGSFYFINGNNLASGKIEINSGTKTTTFEEYQKHKKPLNKRTILLSINGTVGNVALYNNEKCILGKSACYFNVREDVDKLFIKYIVLNRPFQYYIDTLAHGTTIKNVSLKTIREFPFLLPPLPEQRAIAGVLSSLDDKIDILRRQNKTLEAMAEALFKQWFIEGADEEWKEGTIADYAMHFKESVRPQENHNVLFDHYSIPAFDAAEWPLSECGETIQSNKYRVVKNCVLFSKLNPHRDKRIWLISGSADDKAICSTEFQVVLPKKAEYLFFTYCCLSLKENYNEIAAGVGGTSGSHQRIDPQSIFSLKCPIIPMKQIEIFNHRVSTIFEKKSNNQHQIRTLIALRDTLLPKLMSGEVRVSMGGHDA